MNWLHNDALAIMHDEVNVSDHEADSCNGQAYKMDSYGSMRVLPVFIRRDETEQQYELRLTFNCAAFYFGFFYLDKICVCSSTYI